MNYLEIIVKLRKIIRSINLESKRIEKEHGISIPQLLVLQFLSKQSEYKASAKDIKEYVQLNASTTSGIINRLEIKSLVARLSSPDDRRTTFICLTAKGADLLRETPTTLQEKLSKRLQRLPEKEVADMIKNIDLLIELLDVHEIDAAPILMINEMNKK